ncbi:uncharacterized protein LOC133497570 isoform X2 [Syngnathoides biaculeatus]|uniref:uncharacterized protein LOC133497570 isoform X2 n=1 Tax=Syngnathoides biaculeatus TaxID=300417 RepID=UPI002ADE2618|nr:uncharacterized protein LOC133497570 isoform X2 [Syngnathoides biaculeatus]
MPLCRSAVSVQRGDRCEEMCGRRVKEEEEDGEQLCGVKEEKEPQRQPPDARCKQPQHVADVREEDFHPEEWEAPPIKKEEEEPDTPRVKDEEQDGDVGEFPSAGVTLKDEDDEGGGCGASRADGLSPRLSGSDVAASRSSEGDRDGRGQEQFKETSDLSPMAVRPGRPERVVRGRPCPITDVEMSHFFKFGVNSPPLHEKTHDEQNHLSCINASLSIFFFIHID